MKILTTRQLTDYIKRCELHNMMDTDEYRRAAAELATRTEQRAQDAYYKELQP